MTTKEVPPTPSSPLPLLLSLPPELRQKIYTPLLTPQTTPLTITPLFIRTHYKTLFTSQYQKSIYTPLLLICKQITTECLPILYAFPTWRVWCRLEQLASQIGIDNFGLIKRMEIDVDDLRGVLEGLRREKDLDGQLLQERSDGAMTRAPMKAPSKYLRFGRLEELCVEGWQRVALTSQGVKASRVEGRELCSMAVELLGVAPGLNVLVQVGVAGGIGGSDARDLSMGRVRWRFVRSLREVRGGEYVVELVEMMELFDALIEMDEVNEKGVESESWRGGVFRQYPYLERA